MTMHDDDDDEHGDNDDDDDNEDDDYIEDGDNDDDVREMIYAEQFYIPMCRMNNLILQYGTVIKSFETVLVPYCRQATTRTIISTARTLGCHAWPDDGRGVAATSAYEYGGYI